MSHLPSVSIGLPVYNGASYLESALRSLLGQTFTDFELIISDNASTDDTEEICRSYSSQDGRIRYLRQAVNIGAIRNFNGLWKLSKAPFFKWAAVDDLCEPTYLKECVRVLDCDADVAWCHTRSSHIDPQGRTLEVPELREVSYALCHSQDTTDTRESLLPQKRFRSILLGKGGCLDSYGVIRSDVIRRTQLLVPFFGAEKVFIAELSLYGRYHEVPQTLFHARVHPQAVGSLRTVSAQQKSMNPTSSACRCPRLGLLMGYLRAIRRSPLTFGERARCYCAVAEYLLQFRKWRPIAAAMLAGRGMGGDDARSQHHFASSSTASRPVPDDCENARV